MENIKLSEKDKKILSLLDLDARTKITELAKALKVSKEVVFYRLKRLESSGIIENYSPVINPYALGKYSFHLYLSFSNKDLEERRKFGSQLINLPGIRRVVHAYGKWDFILTYHFDTIKDFEDHYEQLLEKYEEFITEKRISVIISTTLLQRRKLYQELKADFKKIEFGLVNETYEIKEKEEKIINELIKNARISLVDLSRASKLSLPTVRNILDNLNEKGVIVGYYTNYNYEKFGLDHYKLLISLKKRSTLKQTKAFLEMQPQVIQIQVPLGSPDLEIELYVDSLQELEDLIGKITNTNEYITDIEIIPIMEEKRVSID